MSLYAAYAGNLDARLMSRRAPHSPLRGTGWLNGWRLTFGGERHAAHVELVRFVNLRIGLQDQLAVRVVEDSREAAQDFAADEAGHVGLSQDAGCRPGKARDQVP